MRILLVLTGALGDVSRGLFIPVSLREAISEVHITWLVEKRWAPVVRRSQTVDHVIEWNRQQGLAGVAPVIAELRKNDFNVALDLQRTVRSGLFSWISGAKRRIGFHRHNCKEPNWLFSNETITASPTSSPKIQSYADFLRVLGLDLPEIYSFGLSSEVKCRKRIGIVLGASRASKEWPITGYASLLRKLSTERSEEIVLLGDASQRDMANTLQKSLKEHSISSKVGQTSIEGLIDEIAACRVLVGPDTGPGHIAAALGVPYIGLFGPTDPERVAPYRQQDKVITARLGCRPCERRKCPGLDKLCMRLISPDEVLEAVRRELRNPPTIL